MSLSEKKMNEKLRNIKKYNQAAKINFTDDNNISDIENFILVRQKYQGL